MTLFGREDQKNILGDAAAPYEIEIIEFVKRTLSVARPLSKPSQKRQPHSEDTWVVIDAMVRLSVATVAFVIGALTLHRLDADGEEMTGDEGATWAAASAPSVARCIRARRATRSKIALYDVMLHAWMGVSGGSLFVMRAMSAALGSIA